MTPNPLRGEIWSVALDPTRGSEIQKTRPCVVLSRAGLTKLPIRIVVPLTESKPHLSHLFSRVHVPADSRNHLSKDSDADASHVRSVSLERFRNRIGAIGAEQLADIAAAVALAVGAL